MKKRIIISLFLLVLVACGPVDGATRNNAGDWRIIESPVTGNCYEFFSIREGVRSGIAAMAEVECEE